MKSINWPEPFRQQIIDDAPNTPRAAVRLGRLYYDNQYWSEAETVFLRANHKIVRQAVINGALKCCKISELSEDDFKHLPGFLNDAASLMAYLKETYQAHYKEPISGETEVTVVYYAPQPVDPELLAYEDDSHM
ncbi:MAG: hypothetical protein KC462_02780 [Cyanobacteria bacterium HKST-UBA05]|nr:hypothetical protein [Cyanobacteria bacterium HKST-UBA05]